MYNRASHYLICLLLGSLVISGCSTTGPQATSADTLQREELLQAQILLQQAENSRSPQKENYQLQAASFLFYQGEIDQAAEILNGIDSEQLEMGLLIRRQLLSADIAEQNQAPQQVIDALKPLNGIPLGDALQAKRYYLLQIRAYQALNIFILEAEARIGIMAYLEDGDARLDNLQRMLDIALLANQQIETEDNPSRLETLKQLMGQLLSALENWRQRYSHEQDIAQLEEIQEGDLPIQTPQKIGVLLPLSGRYSKAAEAVRDGILSAYFSELKSNEQEPSVELRFYDTHGNQDKAWDAYLEAIQYGAEFIIGPLTKDAVNYLAMTEEFDIPLLTLNHTAYLNDIDSGLYQLALSPEDEASQAAIQAWNNGLRNPVILVPNSNWGERVSLAFRETWWQLGGEVRSEQRYAAKENDFSTPIRRAFELDISDQRHRTLQKGLRQTIKFTPRRRQDVDFIFMAAQPRQARLLRPQFKFHYAGTLPIYSTSHLYQGTPNSQQDRDMDGITFGDMPWTLDMGKNHPMRQDILTLWPNANKKHWRLYALGVDAYKLSAFLHSRPNNLNYYGETGHLQLTHDGQLYRQLEWATFQRGVPRQLQQ